VNLLSNKEEMKVVRNKKRRGESLGIFISFSFRKRRGIKKKKRTLHL
jgi:hypothetical protein